MFSHRSFIRTAVRFSLKFLLRPSRRISLSSASARSPVTFRGGWPLTNSAAAVPAAGDADVGLARLPRPVDHAAHDRDLQRLFDAAVSRRTRSALPETSIAGSAAGRAGDDLHALVPKAHGAQDGKAPGTSSSGGPDSDTRMVCADAVQQKAPDAHGGFHRARLGVPASVDAQVPRV